MQSIKVNQLYNLTKPLREQVSENKEVMTRNISNKQDRPNKKSVVILTLYSNSDVQPLVTESQAKAVKQDQIDANKENKENSNKEGEQETKREQKELDDKNDFDR